MGVAIVMGTVPSCNTGLSTLSSLLVVTGVTVNAGVPLYETLLDKVGVVVMGGVSEGTMGWVSVGGFGLMTSFFMLERGTNVSLVVTESLRPSKTESLSAFCEEFRVTGLNLPEGLILSLY